MRKILYLFALFLWLCSACSSQQGGVRDSILVNQAEQAYQAGAYEETITDASEAIKIGPTDRAYLVRALAYLAKGDDTKAFSDLNASLNLNPNQGEALVQRGGIYNKFQQYDQAIADLTQAIQLDPAHAAPAIYVQRGNAYTFKGAFRQALADFNQALQQADPVADVYLGRANLFVIQGEYEKAIMDYDQVLQSEPALARAYAGRGDAYFFSAQYAKALADYDQAIHFTADPKEAAALYTGRADALLMQGLYEAAVTDYTKAIALNPRGAEAYAGRGAAFSLLSQVDQAGADLNAAIKLAPTRAQTYVNRGDLYFLRGKYAAAVADYTTALQAGIKDEKRRRQVEQQRDEIKAELQKSGNETESHLPLCTWFARAQFMRTTRLNQTENGRGWQQMDSAPASPAFTQAEFNAWIDQLRQDQPYQKKFIKQWTTLTPPLAAKSFWEQELNAVQQQLIAADQMLVSYATQDRPKFQTGLALWQAALQADHAAAQEMQKIQAQCLP